MNLHVISRSRFTGHEGRPSAVGSGGFDHCQLEAEDWSYEILVDGMGWIMKHA